ncbi:hypothetical protein DMENIID0001_002040 [Sergentomyia squamirostris]
MNGCDDNLAVVAILANVRLNSQQKSCAREWMKTLKSRPGDDKDSIELKNFYVKHLLTMLFEDDELSEPFNQIPKDITEYSMDLFQNRQLSAELLVTAHGVSGVDKFVKSQKIQNCQPGTFFAQQPSIDQGFEVSGSICVLRK